MLNITHNVRDVTLALKRLSNEQLPAVTVGALNQTAYDALDAVKEEMVKVFDRPTRWTLNALMVWRATPDNQKAVVQERPSVGRRHYLKVQAHGGQRSETGVERLLKSNVAYSGFIAAVTPAKGAKLDRYGNWSPGQRNQLLSGVGAQRDRAANTTAASRRRNKGRATFFVPKEGSLSPGVYSRQGDKIEKVVHFTRSMPTYERRIDLPSVIERKAAQVFEDHFARGLDHALRIS